MSDDYAHSAERRRTPRPSMADAAERMAQIRADLAAVSGGDAPRPAPVAANDAPAGKSKLRLFGR